MLHQVAEKTMHRVRWLLTLGWLLLITSLFYDPITPAFTDAKNLSSPFHVNLQQCIKIREACLPQTSFSMSALIWWAMIVPCGIFILLVLGHEFWRRICPLSFLSQIPRALGIQRRRKIVDRTTGEVRREVVTISEHSWLGRNHLYVQFSLFVLGLWLRILYVNSDRVALGSFLLATIGCAIFIGYLYAGKSWCQYFCPMAPVQMVYTGPRSLFGSQNYLKPTASSTQSMCRTVNPETHQEQSACVGCKVACIDIDAEKSYWTELNKPGRRLLQYGYLGMVIAFYLYYFLYAGNWDYYFTGAWTHENDQVAKVLDTGFYLYHHAIPIPKAVAVWITFAVLIAMTFSLGLILEKLCRRLPGVKSQEQAKHLAFTLFTIASFWTFFSYGARPSLNRLPTYPLLAFNALIVVVGSLWLYRTLRRTRSQYERENMAMSLRKQLQKLPIDRSLLEGRSIDDLTPDEIYTLVKVLQGVSQQVRLQTYSDVVIDLLRQQAASASGSFEFCRQLRQELQITDTEHFSTIEAIALNYPELLSVTPAPVSELHTATTVARTIAKPSKRSNA